MDDKTNETEDFPVTLAFGQGIEDIIGQITLSKKALDIIKAAPQMCEFAIAFTGDVNQDGTYSNGKLLEVSLVIRKEQWIKH